MQNEHTQTSQPSSSLTIDATVGEQINSYGPTRVEPIEKKKDRSGWFSAVLVFLLKGGKLVKFVLAIASLAAYSWQLSWQVAVVFMLGLVCHEMGHVWAMRRCGIPTSGFYLIPFMGGICSPERPWEKRSEEAFIASMGPVWGLASTPACLLLGWLVSGSFAQAVHATNLMIFVNLFNLLPIVPLDGGRMLRAVASSFSRGLGLTLITLGVVGAVYLSYELDSFILAYVAVLAALEGWMEYKRGNGLQAMSKLNASLWLTAWLGLGVACVLLMIYNSNMIGDHQMLDMIKNL